MRQINVICYKTREPHYYNKGTEWEKSCDHFLLCYGLSDDEQNAKMVEELNRVHPKKLGSIVIPEDAVYFYASKQEPFDTMGD